MSITFDTDIDRKYKSFLDIIIIVVSAQYVSVAN